MNCVKIRKSGTFYSVFDDDCYVLYFLLDYKISNSKIGFPKSALNKVINLLEENKVNYEIVGSEEKRNFKNLNRYLKLVNHGKEKYDKEMHFVNIKQKIKNVSPEKLEKILLTIENILNEQ